MTVQQDQQQDSEICGKSTNLEEPWFEIDSSSQLAPLADVSSKAYPFGSRFHPPTNKRNVDIVRVVGDTKYGVIDIDTNKSTTYIFKDPNKSFRSTQTLGETQG